MANDDCANAILIDDCNATIQGTFANAGPEGMDNDCIVNVSPGTAGVWYRMTGDGLPVILHTCSGTGAQTGDFTLNVSCICEEPLGTPWTTAGIGSAPGTALNNYCDNSIDISSEGTAASTTTDRRFSAWQNFCDSLTITAKVNSISEEGFAGIAFRESTAAGSKMIALKITQSKYVHLEVRYNTGEVKSTQQFFTTGHKWLRILRNGDHFTGYSSGDGVYWQQHFSVSLALPSCTDAGLFVESTQPAALALGSFSNVEMIHSASTGGLTGGSLPEYVTLYPNPTEGEVNVEMGDELIDKEVTFTIYNQLGQVTGSRRIGKVQDLIETFDVRQLPAGIYFMNLRLESGENIVKKFVVAR